jgi:hypothetical protein
MPTIADIHQNQPLTNLSLQYRNSGYVADRLFPVLPVVKDSDLFYVYGKEAFRAEASRRAPRTAAPVISWGVSTDTYSADEHALSDRIDDAERRNADAPLNLDIDSVNILTDKLLLGMEQRVATLMTNVGVWANSSPSNGWDEAAGTPVKDVQDAVASIIMMRANSMVLSQSVYDALLQSADMLARIQYAERGVITLDLMKALFGVQNILVASAVYDTAAEGQTASMSYVWGDTVWIGYVSPTPGLRQASAGYVFRSKNMTVRKWREEAEHSDAIEVGYAQDEKVTCAELGVLLTNVLQA